MTDKVALLDSTLVSVIIPTKNRKELLMRALKSVLAQTHKKIQIIIVDDASTDGTGETINAFIAERSGLSLQYVRNEFPLGGAGARNAGIMLVKGEFIAFLDDDDEWLPDKTAVQANFLLNNPEYAAVSCLYFHSYGIGSRQSKSKGNITFPDLLWGNVCGSFSFVMVRKDKFIAINAINSALPSSQDWDFWLKIAKVGKIKIIQDHLGIYSDEGHDRISKRYRDIYAGYRNVYLRYSTSFPPQCRRYHLKFLAHIRYCLAANWHSKIRSLCREVRIGSPVLVSADIADLFLPKFLVQFAKKMLNSFGFSVGRLFFRKNTVV